MEDKMSSIDGSILSALEQVDPEEAQYLEEILVDEEIDRVDAEELIILSYDFD